VTEWLLVLLSIGLIVACGAFVAAEFAFVTVDRSSVERAAASGDRAAAGTQEALRTLSTQLSGAQLGITVTNLAIGFLAEPAVAQLLAPVLSGVGVPDSAAGGVALAVSLTLSTAATMVFGELVPKNLAIARPLPTARAVQRFMRWFTKGTAFAIRGLNGSANAIVRRMGIEPQEELASARAPNELASLVRRSADQGTLPHETAMLLERSLLFGEKMAADVLTPRVRMVSLGAHQPVDAVIELAQRTGHSRFPVVGEDLDDVVGIVHLKHAVTVPADRRVEVSVDEVMVAPALVPSTLELDPLLETLRREGLQMAVVIDEFGGTDGVVTLEDLVEELVGDVVDEHDRPGAHARRRPDGGWSLSGLLRPDEVRTIVGLDLPEDEGYETIGGLMSQELGRVPAAGDSVPLDTVVLTVERMDGLRVDRVRLQPAGQGSHAAARDRAPGQASGREDAT
jgi:CBS domain containing-hemolysin-like protein